jgi:predicted MFS family arabinose efflux permease
MRDEGPEQHHGVEPGLTSLTGADPEDRVARGAFPVIAVCTASIGVGSAIGFLFGFIATLLVEDLGLTRAAVGLLTSVYFGSTGLGSVAGGRIADRMGARWAVATNLIMVIVCTVAIVSVRSYLVLLIASVVAGAGYALSNAGTNMAIAAAVPPGRRAIAMTTKTAGVPTVGVVGAFSAPWAAQRYGWALVMGSVGILALAALFATLRWLPDERVSLGRSGGSDPLPRSFLWFPVASFFLVGGSQPLYSWIVPYLAEGLGVRVALAGRIFSGALAASIAVMLSFARRSDRRGSEQRIKGMVRLSLLCSVGVLLTLSGTWLGAGVAVVGVFVGIGAQLGVIGNLHAAIADRAPHAVGRASGVTMTGYYFGALVSPVGFGILVDYTRTYVLSWTLMGLSVLLAALAFHQADRGTRKVRETHH